MKNYEFWWVKKGFDSQFICEFIYEFMKNHEFIYEFMKKTYELGCVKKGFVAKFIYMNSYMNSYSHM